MKFSDFVTRIGGNGAAAWALHNRAYAEAKTNPDVIMLSIGDPEFDTPSQIVETAVRRLRAGDTHYTGVSGREPLKDAIARQHLRITGQQVQRSNVTVLAGAQNALLATSMCIAGPGDEVITLDPMYATYEATIQASGARLVPVRLDEANGFRLDADLLAAAVTPRTRAIFLTNPHNPTGVVFTRGELEVVAALARKHDLWVVSDEVYADLIFDGEHVAMVSLDGMAERTVTISSLSKSHNMPGWRVGWAVGPEALIAHLGNFALCMLYGLPGFIQDAAVVALTECTGEAARLTGVYRERRDTAVSGLNAVPGLVCASPQAGMFVMADVRGTGLSSNDFCWGLYDATKVAVLDAAGLGTGGDGYFRLAYTTSHDKLSLACERIAAYVATL